MPKGTTAVPVGVPVGTALVPALTCEVAAATSCTVLFASTPSLVLTNPLNCSLSLAPGDGLPTVKLLFSAAGYQCMVR